MGEDGLEWWAIVKKEHLGGTKRLKKLFEQRKMKNAAKLIRVPQLEFTKSVVCYSPIVWFCMLSSTESDFQRALNSFADVCDTAEMKNCNKHSQTEVIHFPRNPDQWSMNGATLKHLGFYSRVTEGKTKIWIPKSARLVLLYDLCTNRL